MAKMTRREKQAARALAEKIAEANRARDFLILAQMTSDGRLVRANGETYVSLKPLVKNNKLDTET